METELKDNIPADETSSDANSLKDNSISNPEIERNEKNESVSAGMSTNGSQSKKKTFTKTDLAFLAFILSLVVALFGDNLIPRYCQHRKATETMAEDKKPAVPTIISTGEKQEEEPECPQESGHKAQANTEASAIANTSQVVVDSPRKEQPVTIIPGSYFIRSNETEMNSNPIITNHVRQKFKPLVNNEKQAEKTIELLLTKDTIKPEFSPRKTALHLTISITDKNGVVEYFSSLESVQQNQDSYETQHLRCCKDINAQLNNIFTGK